MRYEDLVEGETYSDGSTSRKVLFKSDKGVVTEMLDNIMKISVGAQTFWRSDDHTFLSQLVYWKGKTDPVYTYIYAYKMKRMPGWSVVTRNSFDYASNSRGVMVKQGYRVTDITQVELRPEA
jgi:hypothetical protein